MVDGQQKIIRAIKIVKPYHAQALVDGWLCIKYLDGREESLSTFADVSKGDMILYGNATRSRPAPAAPCDSCHYNHYPCKTSTDAYPEICIEKEEWLEQHDATIRNQTLDDVWKARQKNQEETLWGILQSLRTKEQP